jgi:hypothetical protein
LAAPGASRLATRASGRPLARKENPVPLYDPNDTNYTVTIGYFDEEESDICTPFNGPSAYTDATNFFEAMKAEPDVCRVEMARRDGGDWTFVAREGRKGPSAEWEKLP